MTDRHTRAAQERWKLREQGRKVRATKHKLAQQTKADLEAVREVLEVCEHGNPQNDCKECSLSWTLTFTVTVPAQYFVHKTPSFGGDDE